MKYVTGCFLCFTVSFVTSHVYENVTLDPDSLQLHNFKLEHPKPIGVFTVSAGAPVELRATNSLNTDIFTNENLLDSTLHIDAEKIPERIVHAKGGGAWGYFEVTHDVSKYTKADVFNGIGKKTQVFARFSSAIQNTGGEDASREMKGLAVKFYTKEGNLDLVAINFPVYFYRDPLSFVHFVHCFHRNPRTNVYDFNMRWDFITQRPDAIHGILWLLSDYGIPDGYRKMDAFPVHTFEINNEHGEKYYVKFNFRTEQGVANLTSAQAMALNDLDYYNRDLYNAIENKDYPSWRLEMDVMSEHDIKNIDYNPFEVIRLWRKGTYHTVTIGRLVLNKNPDNYFKFIEQSAFTPGNLVPGIPGPVDFMFKARRLAYRDTQNHRLGINHDKIDVNSPLHSKTYNRDGRPPVGDNMKDAPNYYPNAFHGPVPYVDESVPKEKLIVLETNAVDLQPSADFYNEFVSDEAHRERLANNTINTFRTMYPQIVKRVIRLMSLVDNDLGRRVKEGVKAARAAESKEEQPQAEKEPSPVEEEAPALVTEKSKPINRIRIRGPRRGYNKIN